MQYVYLVRDPAWGDILAAFTNGQDAEAYRAKLETKFSNEYKELGRRNYYFITTVPLEIRD